MEIQSKLSLHNYIILGNATSPTLDDTHFAGFDADTNIHTYVGNTKYIKTTSWSIAIR